MGGFGGSVVHASYTVKLANGTYETVDTQTGTVQSVSQNSITVVSSDNFSQQYTVGSSTLVYADYDGIGSVNLKDSVSVVATVSSSGGTPTAVDITDVTQVQASRSSSPWAAWGPGRHGTAPSSTTTTTGGSSAT
jgi:hypothetical protein